MPYNQLVDKGKVLRDLAGVINAHSLENLSNTPDFILAEYLWDCLQAFEKTSLAREKWFGKRLDVLEDDPQSALTRKIEWNESW